ncbi:glycosyl transferase family protein [Qipengyuania atrilutea]|uniref:Glycosyl transferase family protein n=1 Tax=Qipengyuania atrilutea TaxID=2744473 RepID=A0A850H498_9SPHN|nr:glycosyl transferase family protein [Actirhodobacter atriluteus]NVD45420.1 glycosyl transferase family protein [Actirhodobacter atriluteus]
MPGVETQFADWAALAQHELLLFAAVFFLVGALDELAIDLCYLFGRLTGAIRTPRFELADAGALASRTAIFIPAWQEAEVIGHTIMHAARAWPQKEVAFFVGCYPNDPDTAAVVSRLAKRDKRIRLVLHDRAGPTCKADCLNAIYRAMAKDEIERGGDYTMVVLHDAEDMVDPAALNLMESEMHGAEFVQIPVLAMPLPASPYISGHYSDEFAEAHGKAMPVRGALGASLPGAGVGCAIDRQMLAELAAQQETDEPFARTSLTEDYELGMRIAALGGRTRFARFRDAADGRLIATRAYFPADLDQAVRQKTRWTHGIALQSWDRLGWQGGLVNLWMQLRDRRGPLAALLLALGYLLVAATTFGWGLYLAGWQEPVRLDPVLSSLLLINFGFFVWRVIVRAIFTAREFGWREALRAVLRMPVSNIITIMAGYRAVAAYLKGLPGGAPPRWDKTAHFHHPADVLGAKSPEI